jgi:hypothetical protein
MLWPSNDWQLQQQGPWQPELSLAVHTASLQLWLHMLLIASLPLRPTEQPLHKHRLQPIIQQTKPLALSLQLWHIKLSDS